MNFLPETSTLLAYSVASVILFITPGPDMSLFLARTMASGRKAGIASVMGANLGCVIHTFLAAFGISALVAASHTVAQCWRCQNQSCLFVVELPDGHNRQSYKPQSGAVLHHLPASVCERHRSKRHREDAVSRNLFCGDQHPTFYCDDLRR
jgi:LysE type translocator